MLTKQQKEQSLCEKVQKANVLRFLIRSMFPEIVTNLSEDQIDFHLNLIATYEQTPECIIENAMSFGTKLMVEFTTENIYMGITQDGMTKQVRKTLQEVQNCILSGSLKDAIDEIKLIPIDKKDPKYLTDARLLSFVNKIETYLNIPLSSSL